MQNKNGEIAFLVEILMGKREGQDAIQIAFAVSGLIAMTSYIPGEDANLAVVKGHAIFVLVEQHQVLWNFFISIRDLIQDKESHNTLPLRVLCDLHGDIEVNHSS